MKAVVVYESMYGNTAAIGEGIAAALRARGLEVDAGPVTRIDPAEVAADVLVVGGPTHAHGMSRPSTRKAAVDDEHNTFREPTVAPGLREWIEELPAGHRVSRRRVRHEDRQAGLHHRVGGEGDRPAALAPRLPAGRRARVLPGLDAEPPAGRGDRARHAMGDRGRRSRDREHPPAQVAPPPFWRLVGRATIGW
jgi:hypothetical protein